MQDPPSITLTLHARQQCRRRHISEEEIREALLHVGSTYGATGHPERTVTLGTTSSGRRLKVISVVAHARVHRIITVADRDANE